MLFRSIPNLAIHMNREVNKGVELNKQTDMLPILGLVGEEGKEDKVLLDFLSKELQVEKEDILDFELWIYCLEKPQYVGMQEELIFSPRLDNLTSVHALLEGLIHSSRGMGLNVIALFDHEEIGSRTKQGAGSVLLLNLLEKIYRSLGKTDTQRMESLYDAFFLSVDVAHGLHPDRKSVV